MKDLTALFDAAISSSLPALAQELRGQYREAGASPTDAATVTVIGSKDNVSVKGNQAIWDVEFGTQDSQPAAVARNYAQNSPKGSSALLSTLSSKLKEI